MEIFNCNGKSKICCIIIILIIIIKIIVLLIVLEMEFYCFLVLKSNIGLIFERNLDDSIILSLIDIWCMENDGSGSEEYDIDLEESFKEDYNEYYKILEEIY